MFGPRGADSDEFPTPWTLLYPPWARVDVHQPRVKDVTLINRSQHQMQSSNFIFRTVGLFVHAEDPQGIQPAGITMELFSPKSSKHC